LDIYVFRTYHSLRIPKRIAELTYLTFVKPGAVDTSDFSDPASRRIPGNNDRAGWRGRREKGWLSDRTWNFQLAVRQLLAKVRIRFGSWRAYVTLLRNASKIRPGAGRSIGRREKSRSAMRPMRVEVCDLFRIRNKSANFGGMIRSCGVSESGRTELLKGGTS